MTKIICNNTQEFYLDLDRDRQFLTTSLSESEKTAVNQLIDSLKTTSHQTTFTCSDDIEKWAANFQQSPKLLVPQFLQRITLFFDRIDKIHERNDGIFYDVKDNLLETSVDFYTQCETTPCLPIGDISQIPFAEIDQLENQEIITTLDKNDHLTTQQWTELDQLKNLTINHFTNQTEYIDIKEKICQSFIINYQQNAAESFVHLKTMEAVLASYQADAKRTHTTFSLDFPTLFFANVYKNINNLSHLQSSTGGQNSKLADQIIQTAVAFHYLSPNQIENALAQISYYRAADTQHLHSEQDLEELNSLSGLAYPDILEIIEASFTNEELKQNCSKNFTNYCNTNRNKYKILAEQQNLIAPNWVEICLLIESQGGKNKGSVTGNNYNLPYYGVMQIGYAAYLDVQKTDPLTEKDFINRAHYDDAFNITIAIKYLQKQCLNTANPTKSLAITLANYNMGMGNTTKYRMAHLNGNNLSLNHQTKEYIILALIYNRALKNA